MVCCGVITLLGSILLPSLNQAHRKAVSIQCCSHLHNLGVAIHSYAAAEGNRLPPFAFSDLTGDIALSGHWGGVSQADDPAAFGRMGMECVNLWALVKENYTTPQSLLCPGAAAEPRSGNASYFPYTCRFSTYCMRFPASRALFTESPELANIGGNLLAAYLRQSGGQRTNVSTFWEIVPQVRLDRSYRLDASGTTYDTASDALLADTFWRREYRLAPAPLPSMRTYDVQWDWCHEQTFNVLMGNGAVRTVRDDGTVAANSNSPSQTIPASESVARSEAIWRYFDGN
jgi:hypothetical protein